MRKILIALPLVFAALPALAVDEAAALAIAKKSNCLACHALDKKLVGPAWNEVGKKYAGDAGAEAKLVEKIKKGGAGVWGPIPMPPNPTAKDEDIRSMVKFILSLK